MTTTTVYKKASECYIQASLDILNHFRTSVKEIHHVGSTSIQRMDLPGEVDVLLLMKYEENINMLANGMVQEGYDKVSGFSSDYIEEVVLRDNQDDFEVNFILMHHESERKDEILYCRDCLNENERYIEQFRKLKKAYLEQRMDQAEYELRKAGLFNAIMDREGDMDIV
ncbi:GrpB family protein [Salinicoccus luteus]|uniref:GrpB family protein n=1 Tax=Salinicoccus luteus TaxID=367840 RepID=UPI0004E24F16|nr:GrpB family protein [Salinicoccus luteus]